MSWSWIFVLICAAGGIGLLAARAIYARRPHAEKFYCGRDWPQCMGFWSAAGWSMFPYLWRFAFHALLGGRWYGIVENDGTVHLVIREE